MQQLFGKPLYDLSSEMDPKSHTTIIVSSGWRDSAYLYGSLSSGNSRLPSPTLPFILQCSGLISAKLLRVYMQTFNLTVFSHDFGISLLTPEDGCSAITYFHLTKSSPQLIAVKHNGTPFLRCSGLGCGLPHAHWCHFPPPVPLPQPKTLSR
ncbi:hypothetical protein AVEN_148154-1 [Araneus ventricosus]|uniref:Uncharacterized protein n=1 Tax=Araneus ventricosus TaxID=182803 RepID=A0A4Y2F662_ARAVE|nr:hypothetical protein AVEN_148154-1 [Araneus ventricosus]